jgi:transcriptional regulator with XRE-family HTH domain
MRGYLATRATVGPMREQRDWPAFQAAVGERLRRARMHANLTQQGLADAADVSRAVVQRIEHGTGSPGLRQLWQIAVALGADPADLLGPLGTTESNRGPSAG